MQKTFFRKTVTIAAKGHEPMSYKTPCIVFLSEVGLVVVVVVASDYAVLVGVVSVVCR